MSSEQMTVEQALEACDRWIASAELCDCHADDERAVRGVIATLAAQVEALRANDARYRWLRENEWDHPIVTLTYGDYDHATGDALDAEIDRLAGREGGHAQSQNEESK